jgi:hypothetical protein
MPTPNPEPTAEQIEIVAEITFLSTDEVSAMVSSPSTQDAADAKWARTLADIALWEGGLKDESGDVKKVGEIEFFEGAAVGSRLDFRNRVLRRYGKSPVSTEAASIQLDGSSLRWF